MIPYINIYKILLKNHDFELFSNITSKFIHENRILFIKKCCIYLTYYIYPITIMLSPPEKLLLFSPTALFAIFQSIPGKGMGVLFEYRENTI